MGISDWLIDEVRTKLDAANKDDIGLLIGATRAGLLKKMVRLLTFQYSQPKPTRMGQMWPCINHD